MHDKYDPSNLAEMDDLNDICNLLNSCEYYNQQGFNSMAKNILSSSKCPLSIIFNNIDGNASNFDSFVADISQYSGNFSIIAIAETNIDKIHKNLYQVDNYNSEYNSKFLGKRKGSGLGIYIHEKYQFHKIEKYCQCTENLETLFVEITNTEQPITVGVVYRPPNGNLCKFYDEFEALIKILPPENVCMTGDYNIDLLKSKASQFEQLIYSHNFIPIISQATHERNSTPTLIDNILINTTDTIIKSGILESKVSDHHPVFSFFECPSKISTDNVQSLPKYDFCESNIEKFLSDIGNNIDEIIYDYNSEENFENFIEFINVNIEKNFKTDNSKFAKSKRNRLLNPWITSGIINSINKKMFYYNRWKKSCNKNKMRGDDALYLRYKKYRQELKKTIKVAKKAYYSRKFESFKGNIKKTWGLINDLRGKQHKNIKASFIVDGRMVENAREISDEFNIFFSSIARNMNAKVYSSTLNRDISRDGFVDYLDPKLKINDSMFMEDCSEIEIHDIIKSLENDKASDISIPILKRCSGYILEHLSKFFKSFLRNGIFPGILKKGCITPIFKKGDSRYLNNYRPVSTLPIFGKIFEKIIYLRLYKFFLSKNVIYENQFGFRKHHSTSHAINYSIDKVTTELEAKNYTIGIFIDLSKAFDTIEHSKLLEKLKYYGIRGRCNDILKSYLSERTQKTKFQGVYSDSCKAEFGVPQGSVLGPLLFLVYINDIVNSSHHGSFVLFADDTNIFVVGKTIDEAYKKANDLLEKVEDYMFKNQLHINIEKSCYMIFSPKPDTMTCARARPYDKNSKLDLYLCGKKLKQCSEVKFLGVMIDEKLSWDAHISHLESKLNSCIVIIKRIKRFIPKSEYMRIYNALFLPHLTYCISCWGGVPKYKLNKIFSIQKRCVRLLFGKEFSFDHPEYYETCARTRTFAEHMTPKMYTLEHTKPIFNEHEILNLENLYTYHTFMEVFKILKYQSPVSLYGLYHASNRTMNLILPRVKSDKSKNNFTFKSSAIWNNLLGNILRKCEPEKDGLIIPGSAENSDLSAPISFVKLKSKSILLASQKSGHHIQW